LFADPTSCPAACDAVRAACRLLCHLPWSSPNGCARHFAGRNQRQWRGRRHSL